MLSTGLAPAVLPVSPLNVGVPGLFSQPSATNSTAVNHTFPSQGGTGTTATVPSAAPTTTTTTPATVGNHGQVASNLSALAQDAFPLENSFSGLMAGTLPLSTETLRLLAAGAATPPSALPFGAPGTTTPAATVTPAPVNVSLPQLAGAANGQVPANLIPLGGFNRGLVTNELAVLLSGGGGAAQSPEPDAAPPPNAPAPAVQPVPDGELQEPGPALAPDAGPRVDGNALPIVLAPENEPEHLAGWDVLAEVPAVPPPVVRPATPARPAVVVPEVAPVASRPSLWSRFVSVACFAAGALGAVWFPDIRELGTPRGESPVLRQQERRRPAVRAAW